MSDYRSLVLAILFVASVFGCANSIYLYEKGKFIKKLQKVQNRSTITELLIKEYKHFFEFKWWHWLSWIVFAATSMGIIFDSY
jgi:hypothetical protein